MEDLLTQLDRDIEQLYQRSLYDYNKKDNYKADVQKICKVIDDQLQEENQLTKKQRVELYYLKGKVQDIIPSYSKQAEESLTKAMKLNPQHCESMNILGHILWKKKDYIAAKQCFEQVLEKDPKNLKALQYLSVTLRQTWDKNDKAQQFERSLVTAKQALVLDLNNSHSWYLVGNAYLSNYFQNPKKDNQALKQALSAYNKSEQYQQFLNPDLLFNRATIHSYYEDYQLSFKDLREALKIDEDLVKDHLQRLEQKLLFAQDLIQNKCKISQKKLINIIKQIPLGLKHPPQNLNKNVKIVQLSDLQEGVNVDKILACKSLQAYTDAQTVPAGFIIVDAKSNFGSLSIYHITQEIYDRIKDNTDLYIIDPVIKTIMCTINDQVQFLQNIFSKNRQYHFSLSKLLKLINFMLRTRRFWINLLHRKTCLSSESAYKNIKDIKDQISRGDEQTLQIAIQCVNNILRDEKSEPIQKVLSLRVLMHMKTAEQLVKELMDMHLPQIIEIIQHQLLPQMESIALFKITVPERGKYMFTQQPDDRLMMLGNTLLRLCLECIFVWNIWHQYEIDGSTSKYHMLYKKLLDLNVQFPKLHYFDPLKVKEYYLQSKEELARSAYFQMQNSSLVDSEFNRFKKLLENNFFNKNTIAQIYDQLIKLNTSNKNQRQFIINFKQIYNEYLINKNFDDLTISIQSICLEYDDIVFDKQAVLDAFQNSNYYSPSKIQGSSSTDKYSQFLSQNSFSSGNSVNYPTQSKQIQILNEKDRKIEKLISENQQLAQQIQMFEQQINSIKSLTKTNSNSD